MANKIVLAISGKAQSGKSSLAKYLTAFVDYYGIFNERKVYTEICKDTKLLQDEDGDNKITIFNDLMPSNIKYQPYVMSHNIARNCRTFSFAHYLKKFCVEVLGLTYEQCYGDDDSKNSLTKYKWEAFPAEVRLDKIGYMTAREVMKIFSTDVCRKLFGDDLWVRATARNIREEDKKISIIDDMRFISEVLFIKENFKNSFFIRLKKDKNGDNHKSETELDNFDWLSLGDRVCVIDNSDKSIMLKNSVACNYLIKILKNNFTSSIIKGNLDEYKFKI